MGKPTPPTINLDTPLIRNLRDHLLDLSAESVRPTHGGTRTEEASPEERAVLTRFRPFAELFYLVAAIDGTVDGVERQVMLGAFRALTGGRVSSSSLKGLVTDVCDSCAHCDVEERLESICSSLASDREDAELAFTLASAVALANKKIEDTEIALLNKLASWLQLSPKRIADLFEAGRRSLGPATFAT